MKRVIIISTITTLFISSFIFLMSFKSATNEENYIIVRVFENQDPMSTSNIIVSDGIKIIKSIELNALKPKNQQENLIKIATTLSEIKKQGYTLISSNNGGVSLILVTNYIFEKK